MGMNGCQIRRTYIVLGLRMTRRGWLDVEILEIRVLSERLEPEYLSSKKPASGSVKRKFRFWKNFIKSLICNL
jgi:hypothetical protein